jgi:DHA2 family multidrug resistance protein-like MFS transporter
MVAGTPESKAETKGAYKFDTAGVLTFMIMMVSLQVLATQGGNLGWTSLPTLGLIAASVVFAVLFVRAESGNPHGFVDFKLFRNMTYTGATISNFLLNATAGILIVAMLLVQLGGGMTAQQAGILTIGYAIAIVAFIRVGERLLRRYGPRQPMIWGSLIVGAAIVCLLPTHVMLGTYKILTVAGFTLFGLGLAFYATPSTDAALSALPDDQAGSGAGIYKMASSLGASFGVAISATVFTALSGRDRSIGWIEGVISYAGRQDNLAIRQAALAALAINLLMVVAAIVAIMVTIPDRKRSEGSLP